MSKKEDEKDATVDDLRAQLQAEKDKSDRLQKESEERQRRLDDQARDAARRDEEAARARSSSAQAEPTEEQWVKLEEEYAMNREQIRNTWKLAQRVAAPLAAEIEGYKVRAMADDAVRRAKSAAGSADAQFPKYEAHVDEYLSDLPLSEKANPAALAKHMDRALLYAQGKARKSGGFREVPPDSIRDGGGKENKDDSASGFGRHEISGMPLTIDIEKRVPDDFRKMHADPERVGAVRMNERQKWNEQIPVKPR